MIILIVGSTGAGKTTYAKTLSKQVNAAVFSIDDWMKALYWQDMPAQPDNQWFVDNSKWYVERIHRCEELIYKLSLDRAKRRESSILDLGFSTADHRKQFIERFSAQGIRVEMHFVDASPELRWQRVQERNQIQGDTFAMHVDRQMFDYIESIFEPPQETEGAVVRHHWLTDSAQLKNAVVRPGANE